MIGWLAHILCFYYFPLFGSEQGLFIILQARESSEKFLNDIVGGVEWNEVKCCLADKCFSHGESADSMKRGIEFSMFLNAMLRTDFCKTMNLVNLCIIWSLPFLSLCMKWLMESSNIVQCLLVILQRWKQ